MILLRQSATLLLAASAFCALPSTVFAFDSGARSTMPASPCSLTVEAAAHAVVGGSVSPSAQTGYRAQDIVVDPVLRKLWVRVADCSDSRRPLTLVPIAAPLANSIAATSPVVASASPVVAPIVRRGDAVDVIVQSSTMRMNLHGKATGEAGANGEVEVQLDSDAKGEEAPKRMRGIATAAHRVEVHL